MVVPPVNGWGCQLVTLALQYEHRGRELRYPLPAMTTIQCKDGITYEVINAKHYIHNGNARISYTCKRPRGNRSYLIIGYENGLFSTAV